jgi:hypothetical protein
MRLLIPMLLLTMAPARLSAQDQDETGWKFVGQLTSVWTGGNSESRTFGLTSTVRRIGERKELKIEAGGIQTESARKTRRAIGSAASFEIEEIETRQRTAEAYYARARYDHTVRTGFLVFGGVDVLRNTFAGIDHRTLIAAGAGNVWYDTETFRFTTDYGATWTFQRDVVNNPFVKSNFPGARLSADLRRTLTATTRLESALISDVNFADTDDIRVDFTNSVSVAVNSAISLKPGLQLLWRNQPALASVDLFTPAGEVTGAKVSVPLETLDSFFTLALVVKL